MSRFRNIRSAVSALRTLGLLAPLAMAGAALAQTAPSPITTELSAQKIVVVTAADGSRSERLESLASVVPGDAIRYTVSFSNNGTLPASGLVVSLPLPREMTLAEPVESTPDRAVAYSVDGGTRFAALATLSVTDSEGRTRPATLADVTHVQWTLATALAPGASGAVSCRATLK